MVWFRQSHHGLVRPLLQYNVHIAEVHPVNRVADEQAEEMSQVLTKVRIHCHD